MKNRVAILMLAVVPLGAQDYFPHHNFTFGAGVGRPRGDLGSFLEDSPGISIGYGYRFHRYFQADLGLDILFGAAGVRDYLPTEIGYLAIRDREYFVPLGGRAIAPLAHGRVLISGGGGGAYMRYGERIRQPSSYFRVGCPVCTERSGWGYYAQGNVSVFLDRNQHFRAGVTTRVFRGYTSGLPVGTVPGLRTKDHWLSMNGEFGFSF